MIAGVDYTGIAVTFLCHDGNGNFVLGKRSKHTRDFHGHWDFGGGKLEFGETVEEAIARELSEEFGCTGIVEEFLPPLARVEPTTKMHWAVLRFIIHVNQQEVKNNELRSIDEIGWFKLNNLPQPMHPGILKDLEYYMHHPSQKLNKFL